MNEKYQIYKDVNNKFGIRDTNIDTTIISCDFDNIEWYPNSELIKFTLNGKQAVCSINDILSIKEK